MSVFDEFVRDFQALVTRTKELIADGLDPIEAKDKALKERQDQQAAVENAEEILSKTLLETFHEAGACCPYCDSPLAEAEVYPFFVAPLRSMKGMPADLHLVPITCGHCHFVLFLNGSSVVKDVDELADEVRQTILGAADA